MKSLLNATPDLFKIDLNSMKIKKIVTEKLHLSQGQKSSFWLFEGRILVDIMGTTLKTVAK